VKVWHDGRDTAVRLRLRDWRAAVDLLPPSYELEGFRLVAATIRNDQHGARCSATFTFRSLRRDGPRLDESPGWTAWIALAESLRR